MSRPTITACWSRRACGCPIGELGLPLHVHTLRSVEKLSSEGMSFIGSDLIVLIEETLPQRFGGSATDYQFVEEEVNGLPKVSLLVSPQLGTINEPAVVSTVLETLGRHSTGTQMMADVWRGGGTLLRCPPPAQRYVGGKNPAAARHSPILSNTAMLIPLRREPQRNSR